VTAFDAPVAKRVRRSAARPARITFTVASSKAPASATQDAFHRRVPRSTTPLARRGLGRETRHRSRDFAAPVRLPALLRPPLPEEEGLDQAASARSSRPGALGHAPLVDFCNRKDPQARPSDLRNPAFESGRSAFAELPISRAGPARGCDTAQTVPFRRARAEDSRVRGRCSSGFACAIPAPAPSRLDCSRRELRPNPIDSRTPLVAPPDAPRLESPQSSSNGPANLRMNSSIRPRAPTFVDMRAGCALSRTPDEGRLPHPFAKRRCVPLHPRCLPSEDPLAGGALFHSLSPTCGVEPAPFQSPRHSAHGRCVGWCGDSAFHRAGGLTPSRWVSHSRRNG